MLIYSFDPIFSRSALLWRKASTVLFIFFLVFCNSAIAEKLPIPRNTKASFDKYNSSKKYNHLYKFSSVKSETATTADLLIVNPSASPSTLMPGDSLFISCTVINIGSVSTGKGFQVKYFLSADDQYDTNDVSINDGINLPALDASLSDNVPPTKCQIPSATSPGNYYILMMADFTDSIQETDETNNIASYAIMLVSFPDFKIQSPSVNPLVVFAGDSLTVSALLQNSGGNGKNSEVVVQYFISQSQTPDASSIPLSNLLLIPSPPAGKSTVIKAASFLIPASTAPGQYFVLLIANVNSKEQETDESNNVAYVQIEVQTRPDFLIAPSVSASFLFPGDSLKISATITNPGSSSSNLPCSFQCYFSSDLVVDPDDVPIDTTLMLPSLAGGASFTIPPLYLHIPKSTLAGKYYILFIADKNNQIKESDETNNLAFLELTIANPNLADLFVKNNFVSPSSLVAGDTLHLQATISNQGVAAAAASHITFLLSSDALYDEGDLILSTQPVPFLPISGTYTVPEFSVSIPTSVKAGTYYILFFADSDKSILEASETNNLEVLLLKVAARSDLSIADPAMVPSSVYRGDSVHISCTTVNLGQGSSAGYVSLQYFLSTDTVYDIADVPLSNFIPIAPLKGFAKRKTGPASFRIPEETAPGNYYLLLFIDNTLVLKESREDNNLVYLPFEVLGFPDLAISASPADPNALLPGDQAVISATVKNQGDGDALTSWNLQYFISRDQRLDKTDTAISLLISLPPLAAGAQSSSNSITYTFSAGLPSGTWYILVKADADSLVRESDETNNIAIIEVVVGNPDQADLAQPTPPFAAPSKLLAGDSISMECTIGNIGQKDVTSSYQLQYFLSSDGTFDNSDLPLSAPIVMNPLAVGAKQKLAPTLSTIPLSVKPGIYYVLAFPDVANTIGEASEKNNVGLYSIRVDTFPDLRFRKTVVSPGSVYIGDQVSVAATVYNAAGGSGSRKNVALQYFLSLDPVYDPADLLLSRTITILPLAAAKDTVLAEEKLTIPNIAGGIYYLIAFVDSKEQIIERSETNNIEAIPLEVKPRPVIHPDTIQTQVNLIHLDVKVKSELPLASVDFTYRKITDSTQMAPAVELPLGTPIYSGGIPQSYLDEIGAEYSFLATDSSGNKSLLSRGSVQVTHPEPGLFIPYHSYGKSVNNYRIIAVPLRLAYSNIDSVMHKALGPYDKTKWRIFNYRNKSNTEFTNGIDSIEPGLGYWFIVADSNKVQLYSGAGTTVVATIESPFSVKLAKGWNQIGNPYCMNLSVSDIKSFKMNKPGLLQSYKKYLGQWTSGDTLHQMEGMFVFAQDTGMLYFPTQKNKKVQRLAAADAPQMDDDNWEVSLSVSAGELQYSIAGLGMNEEAQDSKDEFDDLTPPALNDYVEIDFNHPEYFYPKFTKDIIASCDEHVWELEVRSGESGKKVLSWESSYLKHTSRKLVLYDKDAEAVTDMAAKSSYTFESGTSKKFLVYYGTEEYIENALQPERVTLSRPVPNPFSESTTVTVTLPDSRRSYQVSLPVFNSLGQQVGSLGAGTYPSGFHEFTWEGRDVKGGKLPQGMYVIHLEVTAEGMKKALSRKVVVR